MAKQVYKSPDAATGKALLTTISKGCQTPLLEVKFCCLVHPYRYPNSPAIPRYSVTCIFDPLKEVDFLDGILSIEKAEQVESIIKVDKKKENGIDVGSGLNTIKFQTKEKVPVYIQGEDNSAVEIELEDEFVPGEKIIVVYDILRYTKKYASENTHGISFKPTCIYFYPNMRA
jgi:hypothetical protein